MHTDKNRLIIILLCILTSFNFALNQLESPKSYADKNCYYRRTFVFIGVYRRLIWFSKTIKQQQAHTHTNRAIGHVKGWPVMVTYMKI